MQRSLVRLAPLALVLLGALPATAQPRGVTLYSGTSQIGRNQTFTRDEPDLDDTRFGVGRTSSVSVAAGCLAVLYEQPGYRGRRVTVREPDNDLGNTPLGRNSVGSIKVRCDDDRPFDPPPSRGVTLYRDRDREGPSETFDRDVPDLRYSIVGARRASSIDVTPGCVGVLFERPYYEGRSTQFREADNNLGNTQVGEDTASSLRVRCEGDEGGYNHPRPHVPSRERGVTLYSGRNQRGSSVTFREDVPDLSRTRFGAQAASSIAVSRGCVAILYDRPYYRGRSTRFREDDDNLGNTEVGENTAFSLQVSCRDRDRDDDGDGRPGTGFIVPPPVATRGVTLFRDRDRRGPSQTFDRDVPDLSGTSIGARTTSSVAVPRGCTAILFEGPGYRGRSTTFRDDDNNLSNTPVGEDTASSLRVSCQ